MARSASTLAYSASDADRLQHHVLIVSLSSRPRALSVSLRGSAKKRPPNGKGDSHAIPTFGQLRTPGFGGGARHNDRFGEEWAGVLPRTKHARCTTPFARPGANFIDTANSYTNAPTKSFLPAFLK